MTAAAYKAKRLQRGTQHEVAKLLGVTRVTIARRETGTRPVTLEAWLALLSLPIKHNTTP
jgi:transcriptional regulator with XRE-family HTH domain